MRIFTSSRVRQPRATKSIRVILPALTREKIVAKSFDFEVRASAFEFKLSSRSAARDLLQTPWKLYLSSGHGFSRAENRATYERLQPLRDCYLQIAT
jgi:hypothetical protein